MKDLTSTPGERATQSRHSLMQIAAAMKDVISLGSGDPDLATPAHIIRAAFREMEQEKSVSPARGLPRLRSAIADWYRKRKNVPIDPEREILITNGAQEALFLSVMVLVNPGDRVLVPDPRYSSYDQAIEAAGGEIAVVPTGRDLRFELDAEDLRGYSGKLLIFVNPGNPTGALVSGEQVPKIAKVAREAGWIVVSDEVYEGLVFDKAPFVSMLECEAMAERTVTVSSFSKTYAMTGFRAGYLVGPEALVDAAARLKQITSGPAPVFSQCAGLAALKEPQDSAEEILRIFSGRRRVMMQGLDSLAIPYGRPGGTFFIWADISRFGLDAEDFCRRLLEEARVLVFPGTAFGQRWRGFVRISILQSEARITQAVERMGRFLQSLNAAKAGEN